MQKHTPMLQSQISLFTEDELTSLQGGSHVKTRVLLNKTAKVNKGLRVLEQGSILKCAGLSTKSDQDLLLPKTSVIFLKLTEGRTLDEYSVNWPEWGTMQSGEFAMRQKLVRPPSVPGCIWLLTPTASDYKRDRLSFPMYARRHHRSPGGLSEQLYRLVGPVPGRVNPRFYAWAMGFPENWLDSNYTPMAMP